MNHCQTGINRYTYTNFDLSYNITPCHVYYPETIYDIVKIVKTHPKSKMRTSGSHHTFNDMSGSPDILIRTDKLKKILNVNQREKTVMVEAGYIIYDLAVFLAKQYQLTLHVIPAVAPQSVVGALSTGTHGSCAEKEVCPQQFYQ